MRLGGVLLCLWSMGVRADQVYGTVSLNGAPLAGAKLELRRQGAEVVIAVEADAQGRYRVFLEPGLYTATLVLPGADDRPRVTLRSLPASVRRNLQFVR